MGTGGSELFRTDDRASFGAMIASLSATHQLVDYERYRIAPRRFEYLGVWRPASFGYGIEERHPFDRFVSRWTVRSVDRTLIDIEEDSPVAMQG